MVFDPGFLRGVLLGLAIGIAVGMFIYARFLPWLAHQVAQVERRVIRRRG